MKTIYKLIFTIIAFMVIPNSLFAEYSTNVTSTENGKSYWGDGILKLSVNDLKDNLLELRITKIDGTKITSAGTFTLREDTYNGNILMTINKGDFGSYYEEFEDIDMSKFNKYPKKLYVYYKPDAGGWIWVGPITVDKSKDKKPADLTASNPSIIAYSDNLSYAYKKGQIKGSVKIKNIGEQASPKGIGIKYYLSENSKISKKDRLLGTSYKLRELSENRYDNVSAVLDIPSNISAKDYYFGACVNTFNNEGNEFNNCSSSVKIIVKEPLSVLSLNNKLILGQSYKIDIINNMGDKRQKVELYQNHKVIKSLNIIGGKIKIKGVPEGSSYYLRITSLKDSSIYTETNRFSLKIGVIKRKLKISINNSHGSIKDNHGKIDCPSKCEAEYDNNTQITLTATPKSEYKFLNNSGIISCTTENPCTFNILRDTNVETTFSDNKVQKLKVYVTNEGGASGQVSSNPVGITNCRANNQGTCEALFSSKEVVITAHPSADSQVEFASNICTKIEGNSCTLPMSSNKILGVTFKSTKKELKLAFDSMPKTQQLNIDEVLDIDFKVTQGIDNTIDKLQLNLGDGKGAIDCKNNFNIKDVVTCKVSYSKLGNYTLTATAYDGGLKSNILKLPITVAKSSSSDKYTGHQNQEHLKKFWTDNPTTAKEALSVDTATGTQTIQLNFLPQTGQIDLNLGITYNSGLAKDSPKGKLGQGWSHGYGILASIEKINTQTLILHTSSNRKTTFRLKSGNEYISASRDYGILPNYYDKIIKTASGYILEKPNKSKMLFDANGRLEKIVNKLGIKLDFQYDSKGKLSRVFEPISKTYLSYTYNSDNSIASVSDIENHTIHFQYTGKRLTKIVEPDNTVNVFEYNSNGEMTKLITRKDSERFTYFLNTYDDKGRVIAQKTNMGYITKFSYDETSSGIIKTVVTLPSGKTRKYTYNHNYQLLEFEDELHYKTINKYTLSGQIRSTTNPKGLMTKYTYSPTNGQVEVIEYPNNTSIRRYYDDNSNLIHEDDTLGYRTSYIYQDNYLMKIIRDVKGTTKTLLSKKYQFITPYAGDNKTKIIDIVNSTTAKGNKTTQTFLRGKLYSTTTPEGIKTIFSYNPTGTVKEQKLYNKDGSLVGTTKFDYDAKGRVIKITDAENHSLSKSYAISGNLKTVTDAKGNKLINSYDVDGNLIEVRDALGGVSKFEYSVDGFMVKSVDANGNIHHISYDAKGRKENERNHNGKKVVEYVYDELDMLTEVYQYNDNNEKIRVVKYAYNIPQKSKITTTKIANIDVNIKEVYDNAGRVIATNNFATNAKKSFSYENYFGQLTSVVDEIDKTVNQSIDNEGNIKTLTDTNKNTTTFAYDSTPNKTEEQSALGKVHKSTYNAHQLLESFTNARNQTQKLTYYRNGWLKSVTVEGKEWNYVYDANGNLLSVSGSDGTIKRTYDALNRVTSYTDTFGDTQHYSYDKVGNLLSLTYPDGKVATYTYDHENRMSSLSFDGKKLVDYSYTRTGKLKSEKWANGITRTYRYSNGVNELESMIDKKSDGSVVVSSLYKYNAQGNIIKETKTVGGEQEVFEYTYDKQGTLLDAKITSTNKKLYSSFASAMSYDRDNRIKTIDNNKVTYDADGNMLKYTINGKERVLEFDALGRLTKADDTTHSYNIENSKTKTTQNGKTTKFTINPNSNLSQLLVETLPNGDKVYHVYGMGLVATIADTKTSFYHFDYRGSTMALTNMSGEITDSYKYLPYGKMVNHQGLSKTRFLYVGKYGIEKEASGLLYMRARYYDAELKRFVSKDSLVGNIANSKSLNRYAYVEGNPVMGIDVRGTEKEGLGMKFWGNLGEVFLSGESFIERLFASDHQRFKKNIENGDITSFSNFRYHYRYGEGETITIDINEIYSNYESLRNITISDFDTPTRNSNENGDPEIDIVLDPFIYGKIAVAYNRQTQSIYIKDELYNFDWKENSEKSEYTMRNIATVVDKILHGRGTPFPIHIQGSIFIGKESMSNGFFYRGQFSN